MFHSHFEHDGVFSLMVSALRVCVCAYVLAMSHYIMLDSFYERLVEHMYWPFSLSPYLNHSKPQDLHMSPHHVVTCQSEILV